MKVNIKKLIESHPNFIKWNKNGSRFDYQNVYFNNNGREGKMNIKDFCEAFNISQLKDLKMKKQTVFEKIVVRELMFTDKHGYIVLGHELNKMGTIHCFGTRSTRKAALNLADKVTKREVVYF